MASLYQGHCLRNVRLHELFQSDCARLSHNILLGDCLLFFRILLGDPEHSFARCGLAKTEMRLTRDGYAYTFVIFSVGDYVLFCPLFCGQGSTC